MWYSLKCNRLELLSLGRDGDVKKLMKGNDKYAYFMWQEVKVRVWDRYMGMKHVKSSGGGSCTDRGMGAATVDAAGDVACSVDGRVVTEQVER